MCDEAELSLESTLESVRTGRQFAADTLAHWGLDARGPVGRRVEEIVLVTSELLTNAVRASGGGAELRIVAHRDHVLVAVHDQSTEPAVARSAAPSDTGGRRLAIVDALSTRWGTTPSRRAGKVVWSELSFPTNAALAERCRL